MAANHRVNSCGASGVHSENPFPKEQFSTLPPGFSRVFSRLDPSPQEPVGPPLPGPNWPQLFTQPPRAHLLPASSSPDSLCPVAPQSSSRSPELTQLPRAPQAPRHALPPPSPPPPPPGAGHGRHSRQLHLQGKGTEGWNISSRYNSLSCPQKSYHRRVRRKGPSRMLVN